MNNEKKNRKIQLLHKAIHARHYSKCVRILEEMSEEDFENDTIYECLDETYTLLEYALIYSEARYVNLLLKYKVNVNRYFGGYPLLDHAINRRFYGAFCRMLQLGADVNYTNEYDASQPTILHRSMICFMRDFRFLKKLVLDKKVDLNCKDEDGYTPLHKRLRESLNITMKVQFIEFMIRQGARVNERTNSGRTVYHLAANMRENDSVYKILYKYGAPLNVKDKNGETELFFAVKCANYIGCLFLLENYKYDLEEKNNVETTVLENAVEDGYTRIIKLLVEYGANVNASLVQKADLRCQVYLKELNDGHHEYLKMLTQINFLSNLNFLRESLLFETLFPLICLANM